MAQKPIFKNKRKARQNRAFVKNQCLLEEVSFLLKNQLHLATRLFLAVLFSFFGYFLGSFFGYFLSGLLLLDHIIEEYIYFFNLLPYRY